jgi:hypothetical protein
MVRNKEMTLSLVFSFTLEYTIRNLLDQEGLKLNGSHQLLDRADGATLLDKNLYTMKGNIKGLLDAGKVAGSRNKTEHRSVFMSLHWNAEQNRKRPI